MASWRQGGRLSVVAGVIALLVGCASEATPLLREDGDRFRADLPGPQEIQASRSALLAETQANDRRTAQTQASDLYQTAYIDFTRGNYDLAVAAFREYLRLYPSTNLAENAQYWIAESHFSLARAHQARNEGARAVQELERAVQEFRKVVVAHPRGDRVPAALYKEALALVELGQVQLAQARLQFVIDQFPGREEAAKAKDELARIRKR